VRLCGGKIGLSWGKSLLVGTPVPLALAAGFLVPSARTACCSGCSRCRDVRVYCVGCLRRRATVAVHRSDCARASDFDVYRRSACRCRSHIPFFAMPAPIVHLSCGTR